MQTITIPSQRVASRIVDTAIATKPSRVSSRVVAAAVAGNALEFYDFLTYAFFEYSGPP